jgi:hypothetical protein
LCSKNAFLVTWLFAIVLANFRDEKKNEWKYIIINFFYKMGTTRNKKVMHAQHACTGQSSCNGLIPSFDVISSFGIFFYFIMKNPAVVFYTR